MSDRICPESDDPDCLVIHLWRPTCDCHLCGAADVNSAIEWYEDHPCAGSGFFVHACDACHDAVCGPQQAGARTDPEELARLKSFTLNPQP